MSVCSICGGATVEEDGMKVVHDCGLPALHLAACKGNIKKLRTLLSARPDLKEKDAVNGYTPLHFASLSTDLKAVGMLLDSGADMSWLGDDGRSCLHLTAEAGRLDFVRFLLKRGAKSKINTTELRGKTALHLVAINGSEDVARLLLDNGADPTFMDVGGCCPLDRAANQGTAGVVRQLLGRDGVDVNSRDNDGLTPLYAASSRGHIDIIRMLIKAGADVNKEPIPICVASQQGLVEAVKELVAAGADVDKAGRGEMTALHVASKQGQRAQTFTSWM